MVEITENEAAGLAARVAKIAKRDMLPPRPPGWVDALEVARQMGTTEKSTLNWCKRAVQRGELESMLVQDPARNAPRLWVFREVRAKDGDEARQGD